MGVSIRRSVPSMGANCFLPWAALALLGGTALAPGAGVTLITHGFQGNVSEWVIPMGDKVPQHPSFPGSNSASYQISITRSGSTYSNAQTFLDGVSPLTSDSGEMVIALDWSSLSGFFPAVSTSQIATQAAVALLATNLIPELAGRPLAELPLHLVGHSRGASLVAELARILGAQGIWVDHVTTLDPYPLGLNGDPAMANYANVLFADNYWQNMDTLKGQALAGAYNRQLASLNGGYSSAHSDTHLWYHATIDLKTPTGDNLATLTGAERTTWWTATEAAGTNAGFRYSLIGGGDRLSSIEPAGPGNGRIVDGFNKVWDLGAGVAANRTALPLNNGAWPNLIRLNLVGTNTFAIGEPIPLAFYHQYAASTATVATVQFSLDADLNPYNGNELPVAEVALPGTGTNNVFFSTLNLSLDPASTLPGTYALFARISDAAHARYLYAPQRLVLAPSRLPPVLTAAGILAGQFRLNVSGWPGQTMVIQASTNLDQWVAVATNTLAGTTLVFIDPDSPDHPQRYYRARLLP